MGLLDLLPALKTVLDNLQNDNRDDPNQKTASPKVYDRVRVKIKDVNKEPATSSHANQQQALLELLRQKIEESQRENQVAEDEETAESVVFDKMREEMEHLFQGSSTGRVGRGSGSRQVPQNPSRYDTPPVAPHIPDPQTPQESSYDGIMPGMFGTTDSGGGSITMRLGPDMSAQAMQERIPHGSQIQIVETTRANQINIDGQISGWCRVDYNGQKGWILDKYFVG